MLPANTWYLLAVLAATLLGAILRFHKLADANLWEDEARTAWFQRLDVPTMLFATASDTQPPLSYLLFHLWRLPAGSTAYALRFLAALLGVATIPACAGLGRRLGGPTAGAIAALLIAIARFHVWWSQQIRMYSLVTLLGTISLYCFLAAMHHRSISTSAGQAAATASVSRQKLSSRLPLSLPGGVWLLIAMAVANLANLYTLYFSVMLILLESLFLLIVLIRRWQWWLFGWWTGLQLASIALFLPWLLYFKQHAITFAMRTLPRPDMAAFVEGSWSELALGIDTNVARVRALNIALAIVFVGLLLWLTLRSRRRASAWWLALVVVAIPVSAYLITLPAGFFFSPTYQTRYQLPVLPALVALAGWGMATLPRWWRVGPLALLVAAGAWSLAAYYPTRHLVDDYQSLSRFIQAYERPGDIIVIDPDSDAELFLFAYHGQLPWAGLPANLPLTEAQTGTYFSHWLSNHSAIWLVQIAAGHDAGATHPVQRWLAGHLHQELTMASGNKLAALYQASSAPARTLNATLQPQFPVRGIAGVAGYDQPLWDVRPGDILHLALYGPAARGATIALVLFTALPGR
ncbi:MAG: glycosyltransferase family 39 protein, partial [Chloroflexota bacterium]